MSQLKHVYCAEPCVWVCPVMLDQVELPDLHIVIRPWGELSIFPLQQHHLRPGGTSVRRQGACA